MTSEIAFLTEGIGAYVEAHSSAPTALEQRLIDETQQMQYSMMQIGFPQAQFMALLARTMRPTTVVEVGTFTGYSALKVAAELGDDATLIACDLSDEWTSVGRRYWEEAGVADRIDLRLGPAADTLAALPDDLVVDLAFIDADKTGYLGYVEQLIPHLRAHSVVLIDNVLWDGAIIDANDTTADTVALREFNAAIVADARLDVSLLPVGDGLSMIMLARP